MDPNWTEVCMWQPLSGHKSDAVPGGALRLPGEAERRQAEQNNGLLETTESGAPQQSPKTHLAAASHRAESWQFSLGMGGVWSRCCSWVA